jgi:hypothetical protein
MSENVIYHHEHWQSAPLAGFLILFWRQSQGGALPSFADAKGSVHARVNQGRWIAECPAGCGGAIVVSEREPYFVCYECGSAENDGQWYNVVFPSYKTAIEEQLLKRPSPFNRHFVSSNRNWLPGESWQRLQEENRTQGIS